MSYPVTIVQRARVLREAGWSIRRICELVEQETGRRPSINTVAYWTNAEFEARKLAQNRRRHRAVSAQGAGAGARLGSHRHTPEFRLARMIALHHEAKMPISAIARLMSFDYGVEFSRHLVERAVTERRLPVPYGRERAEEVARAA